MTSIYSIYVVWLRYFSVFKKDLTYGVVTTFVEPLLFLASFGFGLGGVIGSIEIQGVSLSYRSFVLAGLIGQSTMMVSFFEASYGGFVRMYYQKVFQAIAVTTVTISEVLWGELLWAATRGFMSAFVVVLIGVFLRDFKPMDAMTMLPIIFLSSLMFSSLGMLVAALSRTIESISYPQYLFIFPMFLFCGVFYPLKHLPYWIQLPVHFLPLTAVLNVVRSHVFGLELSPIYLPSLLLWSVALTWMARKKMSERLLS